MCGAHRLDRQGIPRPKAVLQEGIQRLNTQPSLCTFMLTAPGPPGAARGQRARVSPSAEGTGQLLGQEQGA